MRGLLDGAWLLVAVLLTLAAPVLSSANAVALLTEPESLAGSFDYVSAEAHGRFDATCTTPILDVRSEGPGLRFLGGNLTLNIVQEENERVRVARTDRSVLVRNINKHWIDEWVLPNGTTFVPAAGGRMRFLEAQSRTWLNETATSLRWEPRAVDGTMERPRFMVADYTFENGPAVPAFTLKTDAPAVLEGEGVAFAVEGRFRGPGVDYEMPPRSRTLQQIGSGSGSVYERTLETFGILRFDGRIEVVPAAADIHCSGLRLSGVGNATYLGSKGSMARNGGNAIPLEGEAVRISGHIETEEKARTVRGADDFVKHELPEAAASTVVEASQAAAPAQVPFAAPPWTWGAALAVAWAFVRGGPILLSFFTRIAPHKALRHPVRALLYGESQSRPGVRLRELSKTSEHSYGVLRHHTRVLSRLRLLQPMKHGRDLRLYPPGASLPQARRAIVWENDASARWLVEWMRSTGGSRRDAIRALQSSRGLSRVGAWKAMRRAEQAGLLTATGAAPESATS